MDKRHLLPSTPRGPKRFALIKFTEIDAIIFFVQHTSMMDQWRSDQEEGT